MSMERLHPLRLPICISRNGTFICLVNQDFRNAVNDSVIGFAVSSSFCQGINSPESSEALPVEVITDQILLM